MEIFFYVWLYGSLATMALALVGTVVAVLLIVTGNSLSTPVVEEFTPWYDMPVVEISPAYLDILQAHDKRTLDKYLFGEFKSCS